MLKKYFFRVYADAGVYFIYTNDASQIIRSQFCNRIWSKKIIFKLFVPWYKTYTKIRPKLGLEIVSIRFSIRPPIAIRAGSKSKKVRSRSKIYDRDRTFSDFDRRSKLRSGLSIFYLNTQKKWLHRYSYLKTATKTVLKKHQIFIYFKKGINHI